MLGVDRDTLVHLYTVRVVLAPADLLVSSHALGLRATMLSNPSVGSIMMMEVDRGTLVLQYTVPVVLAPPTLPV